MSEPRIPAQSAPASDAEHRAGDFHAVVLAASAGGLRAVSTVIAALPAGFPAAVVVCLHRPGRSGADPMPDILARRGTLPVRQWTDHAPLRPGTVSVLPPASAAVQESPHGLAVRRMPVGGVCDATMTAIAGHFGASCIGVVLTGRLDDAAAGARAMKRAGGRMLVQDPREAVASGMPAATLATGSVDLVAPLALVGPALVALVMAPGGADLLRVQRAAWAG